jgi:hypothetical protein
MGSVILIRHRLLFLVIIMIFSVPLISSGQTNNYWTRSFNEESSLLSGAVVGGGSGAASIYYNPASISEVKDSKFSLNASLFSFSFLDMKNALGNGINIKMSRFAVEPRFVSYMIKSRRFRNWSFEVAILNNENVKVEITSAVDQNIDILTTIPGNERYFAVYHYGNSYQDEWIGAGTSVKLNEHLVAGLSMFVTVKSLIYDQTLDIDAYAVQDTVPVNGNGEVYYVASYENSEYLKYNDYRLTWKGGLLYKGDRFSLGLCVTTPSLGGIYSDGKRNSRSVNQHNITDPETGEPVPDYVVADFKEKKDMTVGQRTPFSISAGFNYYFREMRRTIYSSVEYFAGIKPYKLVTAQESPDIGPDFLQGKVAYNEWLTYVTGARPVFNLAIGSSWTLKKGLLLMGGFRSDFNCRKNLDFGQYSDYNRVESFNVDLYHFTCGLSWNILGQDIITGIEYTLGHSKDMQQLANLSDPVEYIPEEHLALQGIPQDIMVPWFNGISLYFGASFNFGGEKK